MNKLLPIVITVSNLFLFSPDVWAGKQKEPEPVVELNDAGTQLEAKYTNMQAALKSDLMAAIPKVSAETQTKFIESLAGINAFLTDEYNKAKALEACQAISSWRYDRAEKALASATEELALAEKELKEAKSETLEQAKEALQKAQEKKENSVAGLAKAKESKEKALADEPGLIKDLETATKALEQAKADLKKSYEALGVDSFLAGNNMKEKLEKYIVITEATPRGLAEYGQDGNDKAEILDALFDSPEVIHHMLIADGASGGRYGQAMEILTTIQKADPASKEGLLGRLAIAIALEHAAPISLRNAEALKDAPAFADPVKRYQAYKNAYMNGELDPGFKDQNIYNLRMVVSGEEPDDIAAWGRKMLRNYRPDHITTDDYRWRYVGAVKTDVRYGSQDCKDDKPELQFFQNILMNGGVCGRRAFFGRFILRAFGVPTMTRSSPGHAALCHWTPDGWVVCLGPDWGRGSTPTRYGKDLDFLANVQARENETSFKKVKRAQWIGDLVGEPKISGLYEKESPKLWYAASLCEQMAINDEANAKALGAVGTDIGEANESAVKDKVSKAGITDEDRKIVISDDGVITIPAAACSTPTDNTDKIKFMKSNLGGMQLHYERVGGKHEAFEYTFEPPKAGKYELTARIVTPSWKQHLFVSANGAKEPVDIALPFTVGMWETTAPVEIELKKGKNVLTFTREHEGLKGVSIRDFTLKPVI